MITLKHIAIKLFDSASEVPRGHVVLVIENPAPQDIEQYVRVMVH